MVLYFHSQHQHCSTTEIQFLSCSPGGKEMNATAMWGWPTGKEAPDRFIRFAFVQHTWFNISTLVARHMGQAGQHLLLTWLCRQRDKEPSINLRHCNVLQYRAAECNNNMKTFASTCTSSTRMNIPGPPTRMRGQQA